ncbi:hydantoinase/oxoprolinase family protein [Effusibacillus lacus]|uniref:Acetone carboxylase subunit beta n=1 Tax=Effusibacillus lacus TaxID=1348429 RepID=A0A292YML3_9BACL|nr:hydantoinase/oxoprolinase family protein [Effusibacillus lacus]TCS70963.1 N-methylhydantoinase A/oxoprolinase/acetone carboxylase beta subunit [Effusibacillus lacus]GAX90003.1 acetone carboxylase subunit beta [Effusibacillus lacus]
MKKEEVDRGYILALDAGGTMTDTILVKPDGSFIVGKSLTNREDEKSSYLESVGDAASYLGLTSSDIHSKCAVSIYAGTGMLNTILTGSGANVGLLVTRGFEHITVMEGGLTWLGESQAEILHQQLRRHTTPLVDSRNVLGVSERIAGPTYLTAEADSGEVLIPLNGKEVEEAVKTLLKNNVEVIGIMFMNSFVDPRHELKAKEIAERIVQEQGADVPVVCSAEVAPVMKENNRVKSVLFQTFAAEKTRDQLRQVEEAAQKEGYNAPLQTLLSYGGAVTIHYPRLYETVLSGPIGGLTGAQQIAKITEYKNIVTADLGGTSFDVGLVVDGLIGIRKDADFARHRLALPMVALDSVGSGAGSVVRVDNYRRMHIGPQSAGYRVGLCYQYPELTITDINVALGYVDPNYFLGGKVKLNRDKALAGLEERVANPLGLDVFRAGEGLLEVFHTQMKDLIRVTLQSRGYNPSEFTLLCYGGAGPVHMWGYSEGTGVGNIITSPFAAAFSAFGAACAEYTHRYDKSLVVLLPHTFSSEEKQRAAESINSAWRSLEDTAIREMVNEGIEPSQITFRYGVYARYIGQLESFDTPLEFGQVHTADDIDRLTAAFENVYTKIFPEGARFPESGYAITEVYVQAVAPKPVPVIREYDLEGEKPSDSAYIATREVYHKGKWQGFTVWEMNELRAGNVVKGPAIIQDPMTTVVIPPGKEVALDNFRLLHYRDAR